MKSYSEVIIAHLDQNDYALAAKMMLEHQMEFDYGITDAIGGKVKDQLSEIDTLEKIKIAVVSNMTANVIEHPLIHHLFSIQKKAEVYISGVTGFPLEMINPHSDARRFEADFNIVLVDDEIIWSKVQNHNDISVIQEQVDVFINTLRSILKDETIKGQIVGHTIPLSKRNFEQILDYQTRNEVLKIWRSFNLDLIELSLKYANFNIIDLDILFQGIGAIYDETFAIYTEMRFTHEVFNQIAKEMLGIVSANKGMTKKALIFDLDNTLWGGILGDDGLEGIQLGNDFDGKAFRNLQKLGLAYKEQGILLGICSKNEKTNVIQALREHPEMILKEEDFSVIYANWDRKSDNLKNIAKDLNISENSLVFIDDSRFEREEVRANTEVNVIEFPKQIEHLNKVILESTFFNKTALTHEDKKRTEYFKIAKKRDEDKSDTTDGNYENYLYQLEMQLKIAVDQPAYLNRISQLEQRTNQFNLTTRRYTRQFLEEALQSDQWKLFSFELIDRYGSYGCISNVLIHETKDDNENKIWHIASYLLSCRVFSRSVENEIIRIILTAARNAKVTYVLGEYIPTKKNQPFHDIYQKNGFTKERQEETSHFYKHELVTIPETIAWIKNYEEEIIAEPIA